MGWSRRGLIGILGGLLGGLELFAAETDLRAPGRATLTVEITDLKSDRGVVRLVLFQGESGYPDDPSRAWKYLEAPIQQGKSVATFSGVPYGEFALSMLHDANQNGKMDYNWMGIPREGYGASNDAAGLFSAPRYEAARFLVAAPSVRLTLRALYPIFYL